MNSLLKIILVIIVVLFGLIFLFSNLLGDKIVESIYIYKIKNNTDDTLYIEKPYSEVTIYAETVEIKGKLFVKIKPHLDSDFYSEQSASINHRKEELLQWSNINDTLIGYSNQNTNIFKFVFGVKNLCQTEENDNSVICTRIIDKIN